MELKRTGSIWDRLNRNEINQNWETIEGFMNTFNGSQLIERSYNLINKNAIVPGTLNFAGEIVPNDSTSTTEFIPFPPNAHYNVKPTGKMTQFYDKDYNFLVQHLASANFPVISPNGTAYVRSSITNTRIDETYAYQGAGDRPYVDYGFKYADIAYDSDFITDVFSTNKLSFNADGFPIVSTPYDATSNIEYTFGQLGINEFYHLHRIKTDYFNQLVSSDHISPYRIKAVNNPIANNSIIVTGGNHGSDGGGGGFPTGKPISIDVYIDNKKVTSGTHNTNSPIIVKVVNDACAYNTVNTTTGARRDVLRETITYTFYPNVQTVAINMRALEAIEFYGHRGISMQRHNHNYKAYASLDNTGVVDASVAQDFKSTDQGSDAQRLVHFNPEGHIAAMFIDERIGVGNYTLNTGDPRWFMSAGKSYTNTIEQGAYTAIGSGDSLDLSGGYYFGKGLPYATVEDGKVYTIIRNGKRVYCVDDFRTLSYSNYYLGLLPEDENKEVKVVSSVGFSVEAYTTSRGVKITKSSGMGSLMFEVI